MIISNEQAKLKQYFNEWYNKVKNPDKCLFCEGHKIWKNGNNIRTATLIYMGIIIFVDDLVCPRFKCSLCRKSWQLRPPEIVPHKHFQMCIISQAISHYLFEDDSTLKKEARNHKCSQRTVARWICWLSTIAKPSVLQKHIVEAVGAIIPNAPILRNFLHRSCGKLDEKLNRVAEILSLLEVLASAWKLEPPGLRAVFNKIVGEHVHVSTYAQPIIPELA